MSTLIDLSKELKIRAEVLKTRLLQAGQEPPSLDAELPDDDVHLLVTEFREYRRFRPGDAFRRLANKVLKKSKPLVEDQAEPISEFEDSLQPGHLLSTQ